MRPSEPSANTTITICGREFRVGATYRGRPTKGGHRRKILRCFQSGERQMVEYAWHDSDVAHVCSASDWLRWAGEEVAP